jgi:hypothetical protein
MATLKVLLNEKGKVVGTARPQTAASGPGAPQSATLVARPGQRVIDLDVDEKVASLDPGALHAAIDAKYARTGKTKGVTRPRPASRAKAAKTRRSS